MTLTKIKSYIKVLDQNTKILKQYQDQLIAKSKYGN